MQGRTIGAAVAVVALVLGAMAVKMAVDAQRPKGTDAQQINRMLMLAQGAVERGDAAGVGHFVSDDYRDELGLSASAVKYQIREYLRRRALKLEIPSRSVQFQPDPDGKTGSVQFHLTATIQSTGSSTHADLDMNLRVAKERVYYFFIFPGEEWRVTSAGGYAPLDAM